MDLKCNNAAPCRPYTVRIIARTEGRKKQRVGLRKGGGGGRAVAPWGD